MKFLACILFLVACNKTTISENINVGECIFRPINIYYKVTKVLKYGVVVEEKYSWRNDDGNIQSRTDISYIDFEALNKDFKTIDCEALELK